MKFRNPRADKFIEGRLPTKEDNFSEDRYYTDIENVFVRFDPYKDHVIVTFPSVSDTRFKYSYAVLSKLAEVNPSLKELVRAASNVDGLSDNHFPGYRLFSDDFNWYIRTTD